jgi:thiamine biosynthesis lipoprotein
MGTLCEIRVWHADDELATRACEAAFDEMARLEGLTTSWRDSSEVSRINASAGVAAVPVSPETLEVIQKAQWVSGLTDGAFDITIGAFKGLWKFDEDNDGSLPTRAQVLERKKLVDWHDVIVDEKARTVMLRRKGQRMNLEGLAKGYAVDAGVRVLRAAGVRDFIIKAGGDLYAGGRRGDRAWRVGIQDPRGPHGRVVFQLSVEDQAFNTSGDYERFVIRDGVRYHHILDARTGFPARGTRSVTLLAKSAFVADTLDTALFAVGPERAMKIVEELPDVEAVIIDAKNQVHVSSGLAGKLQKLGEPTDGI